MSLEEQINEQHRQDAKDCSNEDHAHVGCASGLTLKEVHRNGQGAHVVIVNDNKRPLKEVPIAQELYDP